MVADEIPALRSWIHGSACMTAALCSLGVYSSAGGPHSDLQASSIVGSGENPEGAPLNAVLVEWANDAVAWAR